MEQEQNEEKPSKNGTSILDMIRKSEKEKISQSKPGQTLGETARWKNLGKSRLLGKPKAQLTSTGKYYKDIHLFNINFIVDDNNPSFKDVVDKIDKVKNDSEVSFGQSQVKIPELWGIINTFQSDISGNKVSNKEVIEFKTLVNKLFSLWNKSKKEISTAAIEKHNIHNKIGTPSFKLSKPSLYNPNLMAEAGMLNRPDASFSGDFSRSPLIQPFLGANMESDKGSILNDVANPKDFQSWSLDMDPH